MRKKIEIIKDDKIGNKKGDVKEVSGVIAAKMVSSKIAKYHTDIKE